jgi:hypothetical protein
MPTDETPDLTVVVPSVNGWTALEPCLQALFEQQGDPRLEILLPDRLGPAVRTEVARRYPAVRILEAEPGTTIPALRAIAFRAATAPIVGVIEDHLIVPPDWASKMLTAHRNGAQVVGGSIENAALDRLSDRAAFLCEYGHCLTPPPPGPAPALPGNNITYRSDLLERFAHVIERGGWEYELHEALRLGGVELENRPEISAGHLMRYRHAWEYAGQRFLYSRSFAALRLRDRGLLTRVGYGLAATVLPPILLARLVSRVWRSPSHRADLFRSLPLQLLFVTAWAAGETAGAWLGPGDALGRVR